jgi:hypothetical protein
MITWPQWAIYVAADTLALVLFIAHGLPWWASAYVLAVLVDSLLRAPALEGP